VAAGRAQAAAWVVARTVAAGRAQAALITDTQYPSFVEENPSSVILSEAKNLGIFRAD
jgi:hypothetical protein